MRAENPIRSRRRRSPKLYFENQTVCLVSSGLLNEKQFGCDTINAIDSSKSAPSILIASATPLCALLLNRFPVDLTRVGALEQIRSAVKELQGQDAAVDALIDEALFTVEDIMLTTLRVNNIEAVLRPSLRRIAPELLATHGVSTVIAARLVGRAGNLRNIRDAAAFAMR